MFVNFLLIPPNTVAIGCTPSTFISLMNSGEMAQANLHLRTIMYAGEPFMVPQLRKLQKAKRASLNQLEYYL